MWERIKKFFGYILAGIFATATVALTVLHIKDLNEKKKKEEKPVDETPEILINVGFDEDKKKENPKHKTDDKTGKILSNFIFLLLFLPAFMFPITNTNLQEEYNSAFEKIKKFSFDGTERNTLATRYVMFAKQKPTELKYPSFDVVILNNKTWYITNSNVNMVVKYDYGTNGFDSFTYEMKPKINIIFTNDASAQAMIYKPKLNLYIGTAFTLETNQVMNFVLFGYQTYTLFGFSFIPCIGINTLLRVDIFPTITYNLFDVVDLGFGFSILKLSFGLTLGKTF